MGFTFCQNCPALACSETAKAFPAPFCEVKLKPRLEIGKIISEAIDFNLTKKNRNVNKSETKALFNYEFLT